MIKALSYTLDTTGDHSGLSTPKIINYKIRIYEYTKLGSLLQDMLQCMKANSKQALVILNNPKKIIWCNERDICQGNH